jgi:hypothetical protein
LVLALLINDESINTCLLLQASNQELTSIALPLALNGMALTAITAMPDIANSASTRIEKQQDHIGLCCGLNGWLARSPVKASTGLSLS